MRCEGKSCAHSVYPVLFSTAACFVFLYAFDFLTYTGPLAPAYTALKSVQIPADARAINEIWFPVLELMLAIAVSAFYFCWRFKSRNNVRMQQAAARYRDGIGFGGFIGLFMGIATMTLYVSLDIPGISLFAWGLCGFFKGLFLGIILTALHPKSVALTPSPAI